MIEKLLTNNTQSNPLDVSKIITTVNAKVGDTDATETRQIIDEREITLQMNVAFIRETTNGAFTFLKNDFSEEHRRIYNNCPDNIFTFLTMYREKYGKFPTGNVTASYYQKSATAGADPELIITSQGASEVSFIETATVTDIISKQFLDGYNNAKLADPFDVTLDYKFNPANLSISAANIVGGWTGEGGEQVEGSVAIVTST